MMRKIIIWALIIGTTAFTGNAFAQPAKSTAQTKATTTAKTAAQTKATTTAKADTTKKLTPYEKLFDKKKGVKSVAGVFTLHNINGKVYFEMPVKMLGKSFLMSSVVDNVSNMSLGYTGQRTSRPMQITFSKTDSMVQIRQVPVPRLVDKGEDGIREAVLKSSLPPVIGSAPISAYNRDSGAVVFDVTSFFISGGKHIGTLNASSFGGFIQKLSTFSKELSALKDVEAYEDNVAIISNMTYTFKTLFLGMESGGEEFLTVELRTTLTLLPEEPFRYRIADYRIGTGVTEFERFNSKDQGSQISYLATRWRLEPADLESYRRGELCEPKKPIVFYVDTLFQPSWREAVKRGLLKWNAAFEKIGFKNVIRVYDYPSKAVDPKFSASNVSYNCVKYAQLPSRNIVRQVNTDPRSGEILSASILFFRDSPVTLQRERLYVTAAVEPEVRGYELTDNLMCNSIELAMMREMGFCLGLTANLAASSWMAVDSLRSPSFTAREGITSSVMDQIKYNFVAQPGDIEKGVKLTADNLGVYDFYAIDWLYRPLLYAKSPAQEQFMLREMISSKKGDRRFYYGREQNWSAYFDPRAVVEDLGDDKIKASRYGINTLKYISENGTRWVNKDEADESYRELFIDFIFLKLYDYYRSLMVNIGGLEIHNKYEGDPTPTFTPIDARIQRESLIYMLEQADDLKWMDNKELLQMSGMNAAFSGYLANNLVKLVFQRIPMVAFAQTKATGANGSAPYTLDQMLGDISGFATRNITRGEAPTEAQLATLYTLIPQLMSNANLPNVQAAKARQKKGIDDESGITNIAGQPGSPATHPGLQPFNQFGLQFEHQQADRNGFETLVSLKYLTDQNLAPVYYKHLKQLRETLKQSQRKAPNEKERERINYMVLSIDKAIGKN